jgi:hypothetical protein
MNGKMVVVMKETIKETKSTAKETTFIQMAHALKEIGRTVNKMVQVTCMINMGRIKGRETGLEVNILNG